MISTRPSPEGESSLHRIVAVLIARLDALQGDTALWQQWMEPLRHWLGTRRLRHGAGGPAMTRMLQSR